MYNKANIENKLRQLFLRHDLSQSRLGANCKKSELCGAYAENCVCDFSPDCHYAHGFDQIVPREYEKSKYKVLHCNNFAQRCKYLTRCMYCHQEQAYVVSPEIRVLYSDCEGVYRIVKDVPGDRVSVFSFPKIKQPERDSFYMQYVSYLEAVLQNFRPVDPASLRSKRKSHMGYKKSHFKSPFKSPRNHSRNMHATPEKRFNTTKIQRKSPGPNSIMEKKSPGQFLRSREKKAVANKFVEVSGPIFMNSLDQRNSESPPRDGFETVCDQFEKLSMSPDRLIFGSSGGSGTTTSSPASPKGSTERDLPRDNNQNTNKDGDAKFVYCTPPSSPPPMGQMKFVMPNFERNPYFPASGNDQFFSSNDLRRNSSSYGSSSTSVLSALSNTTFEDYHRDEAIRSSSPPRNLKEDNKEVDLLNQTLSLTIGGFNGRSDQVSQLKEGSRRLINPVFRPVSHFGEVGPKSKNSTPDTKKASITQECRSLPLSNVLTFKQPNFSYL